jgi:hypothetical protein
MTRTHWALLLLIAAVGVLLFAHPAFGSTKPSFSFAGTTTVKESDGQIVIYIAKSAKASSYSKINVSTADGTAKAGVDYKAVNATQTVANSQLTVVVAIPIIDNATYQGSRSFTVRMAAVRNATIATPSETITITDDEPAPAPTSSWTFCANETETCTFSGTADVRYGANSTYFTKTLTSPVACSNATFGDPLVGTVKHCDVASTAPIPPPPPPVVCPDGTTLPAGSTCPPPPPPPPPPSGSWVDAPLTVGGYACNRAQENSAHIGPCGSNIVYRIIGTVQSSDAVPITLYQAQFYADASGQFPATGPYDAGFVGYFRAEDLHGIAPGP